MVFLILSSLITLLILFWGTFYDIDLRFGYEFSIFLVVFIIGSLKAFADKQRRSIAYSD